MRYGGYMDEPLLTFITDFLRILDISPEHISLAEGTRKVITITSPSAQHLIGPNGEHLRAVNTLARRLVETKFGVEVTAFSIDVNGYHEKQMEEIRTQARALAQRTRLFKHDTEMNPMSSYERLVVHELFAEDPEIETTSEGMGKFRHIVLRYRQGNQHTTV